MQFHSTLDAADHLVMAALKLQATVEAEGKREEMSPTFPDRFAAAVDALQTSLERTIRDGLDLQNYVADAHVPWIAAQMEPSEGPLDGTWF